MSRTNSQLKPSYVVVGWSTSCSALLVHIILLHDTFKVQVFETIVPWSADRGRTGYTQREGTTHTSRRAAQVTCLSHCWHSEWSFKLHLSRQ